MKEGEKSLEKVFEIVETVGRSRSGMTAGAIAAELGLPVSTVFRMVKFLVDRGYLRKSGTSCTLGPALARLGGVAMRQNPLSRIGHCHLEALSEATKETVHLAELRGGRIVYIDKVEGSRPIRMGSLIGSTGPLYCTGVGKVLLAFQAAAVREEILRVIEFEAFTDKTIMTVSGLRKELAEIRRRGYALDDCEHELGVYCVAAPVCDPAGIAVAGISLSGSELYLRDRVPELAALAVAAGLEISAELG